MDAFEMIQNQNNIVNESNKDNQIGCTITLFCIRHCFVKFLKCFMSFQLSLHHHFSSQTEMKYQSLDKFLKDYQGFIWQKIEHISTTVTIFHIAANVIYIFTKKMNWINSVKMIKIKL